MEHLLTFRTKSGHCGPSDDLFRDQKAVFLLLVATKGNSLLIKLPLWCLQKSPSGQEMGQWCLTSYAWPVATVWNQIWCHKDFQRQNGPLRVNIHSDMISPILWKHMFTIASLSKRNDAIEGCIRLTQECSYHYSDFIDWFGLAFSDIKIPIFLWIVEKYTLKRPFCVNFM